MGYDLYGLRVPPGANAHELFESEEDDDDEALEPRVPTTGERAAMDRLAKALLAIDPSAERHDDDTTVETSTDVLHVSLTADDSAIHIPYWFTGAAAESALAQAFEYARVLAEVGGHTIYDPQTETVMGDDGTTEDATRVYAAVTSAIDQRAVAPPRQVPRWKFWKRHRA